DLLFGWFFRLFNFGFRRGTNLYTWTVAKALRGSVVVLILYGGLLGLTYWGFMHLPLGYIPSQDKGYLLVSVQLPDSASLERTYRVMEQVDDICHSTPGIKHTISVSGQSFVLGAFGSNFGNMFVNLDDFGKRHDPQLYGDAIAARLRQETAAKIP